MFCALRNVLSKHAEHSNAFPSVEKLCRKARESLTKINTARSHSANEISLRYDNSRSNLIIAFFDFLLCYLNSTSYSFPFFFYYFKSLFLDLASVNVKQTFLISFSLCHRISFKQRFSTDLQAPFVNHGFWIYDRLRFGFLAECIWLMVWGFAMKFLSHLSNFMVLLRPSKHQALNDENFNWETRNKTRACVSYYKYLMCSNYYWVIFVKLSTP